MQLLKVVTCNHAAALIIHLHLNEILDEVVDAVIRFVVFQLLSKILKVELDLFEVREAIRVLNLLLDLHERVLAIRCDVLSSDV